MIARGLLVVSLCLLSAVALAARCGGGGPSPAAGPPAAAVSRDPSPAVAEASPDPSGAAAVATPVPDGSPPASAEVAPPVGAGQAQAAAAAPVPGAQPIPLHPFRPAVGRARVVALDPGHGGEEVGAAGAGVAEKDVNLRIAQRLRELLEADGLRVVLTRDGDRRATPPPGLPVESGRATRVDLQARIDIANASRADVYVAIHNNGSTAPAEGGAEVWWDSKRPFAAFNEALANQMLGSLVQAIRSVGYPVANRGLKEDSSFRVFQGRSFPIFVLGPPRTGVSTSRATLMPAVLGETLFLTNPVEAGLLRRDDVLDAIARGYRAGLLGYFRLIDEGALALPSGGLATETPNHYDITPPPQR